MSVWSKKMAEGAEVFEPWYEEKLSELCQVLESPESLSFQGEIEQLRRILRPVILDEKEQILLRKPYVGRIWLDEALEDWRRNKKDIKAFLLLGTPSAGKSAFCVNTLFNNPNAICGFLCQWDKPGISSEKNIMLTLAFKMAAKIPDYRKVLLETLLRILDDQQEKDKRKTKMGLDDYNSAELFSLLIINPLRNCIDGSRERVFIILDGLDEAGGAVTLAQSLANNLLNLPKWIGFVITSRPEPEIAEIFRDFGPLVVDVSTKENLSDIYSYFEQTLSGLLENAEDRRSVLSRATKSSEGSFLYAELFAAEVLAGKINLRNSADYPRGLTSFYRQNFERKFADFNTYRNIRCFLELMLADEGLPIEILNAVSGQDHYAYRVFRDGLGSFLVEKTGTLQLHVSTKINDKILAFCHKSLSDWLKTESSSGKYYIDRKSGFKKLSAYTQALIQHDKHIKPLIILQWGLTEEEKIQYKDKISPAEDSRRFKMDYLKPKIASYLVSAEMWHEYEALLLEDDTPLKPYWSEIDSFPANWNMTALYDKLEKIIEAPARSISLACYDKVADWQDIYEFFANSIQTQRLANVFFKTLWKPMGDFFNSTASDTHGELFINYKIYTAHYLHLAVEKCKSLKIAVPKDVEQVIEHVKIACFFCDGEADNGGISTVFNNRRYIFRDNICRMENPRNLHWLKSLFNTYCLVYELYTGKHTKKMRALIDEGADVDDAKKKTLRLLGEDVNMYDNDGKIRKLVGNDAREHYFAINEIDKALFFAISKKYWHPKPAEFERAHYDFDIYRFPCCGKHVVVNDTPSEQPSQFVYGGCEIYEQDDSME